MKKSISTRSTPHSGDRRHYFLLPLLCFIPCLPLFYVFTAWTDQADFVFYSNMLNQFSQTFWSGHIYPRWLPNMNAGLGSPIMLFYGPLPFYLGALLEPLRAFDPFAVLRFSLLILFAHIAGVLAFYAWIARHIERRLALVAAVLLALFPYLISVFYLQSGMSASWAFVFLIVTLIGVDRLIAGEKHGFLVTAFSFACILLCHPPTFIVVSGLPLLYGLCSTRRIGRLLLVLGAVLLGMGISAVYWIPVFFNRPFINADLFTQGKFSYAANFGGLNEIICFPLFLLLPYGLLRAQALPLRLRYFFGFGAIGALFMTLPASSLLWEHIPMLAQLQFPYRFLIVLAICIPPLAAALCDVLPGRIVVIVLFLLVGVRYGMAVSYIHQNRAMVEPSRMLQSAGFSVTRTRWSDVDPSDTSSLDAIAKRKPVEVLNGTATVETQASGATLHVQSDTAAVSFRQFYFPGIQVVQGIGPVAMSPGMHGLAEAALPKGDYRVMQPFAEVSGAALGEWIALISLILAAAIDYRENAS
jgi:hypothetical protein